MPPSALKAPPLLFDPSGRPLVRDVRRSDGWENSVTGFGTSRDKTTYGRFLRSAILDDETLSDLYHHSDMPRRVVDLLPTEMLREPFEVDVGDDRVNEQVAERLEQVDARGRILDAMRWARLYGGSALLLGADDGRPASMPLIPERARSLDYLYVLDRRLLWPVSYYQEPGPRMGEPELFMVTTSSVTSSQQTLVHESRLVLFRGEPTGIRERQQNQGWDYSVLQSVYEVIRSYESGWKAVEIMLSDANQSVFAISGLADLIGAGKKDELEARIALIDMYRSVCRAVIVDAGQEGGAPAETFERQSVSFEGIPQVLDKLMLRMSSAARAPATLVMGMSPGGLNATGESDFRGFYDRVRSEQRTTLTPPVRRIVNVMLAARDFAFRPDAISVEYCPLWSEPPKERAETDKLRAETHKVYVDAGVLLPEEVAIAEFGGEDSPVKIDVKVRESVLKDELAKLEEGKPEPPPPPQFGAPPPPQEGPPEDGEAPPDAGEPAEDDEEA